MKKQLQTFLFLLGVIFIGGQNIYAQQIEITANPGTSAAPALGSSNYVANESIYTEAEIGAGNFVTAATAINSIGLSVNVVGTNTTFNNVSIYMKEVPLTTTTFTTGTYTTTGYTLVYSGSMTLTTTGFTDVALTTPFTRTPGNNLQVLITRTDNITHSYTWNCANGNNTNAALNTTRRYNGTAALSGTTSLAVSAFRQAIRLAHKYNNDANVAVYTLGKIPLVFGNSNHVIQARVQNVGFNALNNINVHLNIAGVNSFTDMQTITTLAPGAEQIVSFNPFTPTVLGQNNIQVYMLPDDFAGNDTAKWQQQVTQNLFSYKNPNIANQPGGIGFNGATGQFVAKYTLTGPGDINEIKVDFTTAGQPYEIGIWSANGTGGQPGTLLWTSPSYNTTVGTAFVPVSPALTMPAGDFYVGVRQTGITNVGFGYQMESPIRPNSFYYTTLNGTAWTAFSGAQPFRFAIEAQMYVPQPPNCATAFNPADKSTTTNAATTTNLTWLSGGGGATDYDVYFGTTYPPPFVGNTTSTSFPVSLNSSTTYYWYVLAKNANGSAVGCDTLDFRTACPSPNTLSTMNVTATSADLLWVEPGTSTTWAIEYGPSPLTAGTGTKVYTGSNPYNILSGLTPATTYQYNIRSICGAGDTSAIASGTFTTLCLPITTLPWTENFDALTTVGTTFFPNCWLKENGDWASSDAVNSTPYAVPRSGNNFLRNSWTAINEYMWTPGFDLVANTSYDFSFFVAGDGGSGWTMDVFQNSSQISTGATQIGSVYNVPATTCCSAQPYAKQTYTFIPSANGTYYFAVRVNQPSSAPWYIAFDDFRLELSPSCPAPVSLSTANVLSTSADLQWVEPGLATQWQVEYGPSPLTLGSGTRMMTTSNPFSASLLTQNTAYQFYVRSVCTPGDTSTWSGPNNFTTLVSCPAPTAISVSNITAGSADITWTSTTGAEILEYGPTGHVPGTGATAGAGGTLITNATSPYTISGLTASSGYDVFIRQDCSASSNGFSSNLSAPFATTGAPANDTICGAYNLTLNSTAPVWVNTTNATVTATDPQDFVSCTGANNNVWYKFTTTSAGVYNITGYSSRVMTVNASQNMSAWAYLYSATGTCPALTLTYVGDLTACLATSALPATNNAPPNTSRSIPTPSLAAATTYYLFLDGNSGSYGNIGITVQAPLTIKLDKISAANVGNVNRIDWNTLSEERGDKFELERSMDSKNFIRIYQKSANNEPSRYTYIDNNALKGMNYYRLRMIAADGSVNYSETVSAFVKSTGFDVAAFPNPVSHDLTVKVSGAQGADATVQVTDITGKVMKTVKMNGNVQQISMSSLASGIYLIKYADSNHTQILRINKQ
ncbi:MAG TPA: T9SS type A sorting domain-containing protein [Flavipsychrobacter sp.]|nr:T9SS type A sorting domain-containing protein [Flavipsychrobacter sp.]